MGSGDGSYWSLQCLRLLTLSHIHSESQVIEEYKRPREFWPVSVSPQYVLVPNSVYTQPLSFVPYSDEESKLDSHLMSLNEGHSLPAPATKLIIGQHLYASVSPRFWAWLIVATFYDIDDNPIWSTEIFLGQRDRRGWDPLTGEFDSGPPPPSIWSQNNQVSDLLRVNQSPRQCISPPSPFFALSFCPLPNAYSLQLVPLTTRHFQVTTLRASSPRPQQLPHQRAPN